MSRHDEVTYLRHMRDYAAEAVLFARDRTRSDLDSDRMLMLATCRLLEMMGESACQLPSAFRDEATGIPWKQMIGLRHRLVHAYDQVDLDIIWNIVTIDLPPLLASLDRLISSVGGARRVRPDDRIFCACPCLKEPRMARKKPTPKDDEEELVVLCFKVLVMPRPLVAGCSKVPCSGCGQPVWISPATLAHVAGKRHRISCAECVARDDDPDTQVMPPSEGQIAEMVANDPTLTPAKIRRKLPASNPARRKAAFDEILRRTKAKKRTDN